VAARIAHNLFRVPRVLARLYDPRRAEIYERLGIVTISSTTWGAERIYELLTHRDIDTLMSFGHGEVTLVVLEIPPHVVGRMVNQVVIPGEVDVVAITRDGVAFLPTLGTEFKSGDAVHFAIHARAMSQFERLMGLAAGG
jgi:trk system potassium uptake protein TrkA